MMIQIECRALLFDMDGVLIDSTPAVTRVWRDWALAHHFNPEEVVARAHGRPSIETIREYLPQADHQAENLIVERREMEDLEGVVPLPGAQELLDQLPTTRWAIVTSATRPLAQVRLRAAGLAMPTKLVTSSEIRNGKPHAEPYLKAAAAVGYAAGDCVVVEDAPAGVQSGRSAGARVIALRTTSSTSELRAAGANWVLKDCTEISVMRAANDLHLELRDF